HRIVDAVSAVLAPAVARIIAQGEAEGVFDAGDPRVAAEAMLGLSNGRRGLVIAALSVAETDVETSLRMIVERVRAEEGICNRILGLASDGVDLLGPETALREMIEGWNRTGRSVRFSHVQVRE